MLDLELARLQGSEDHTNAVIFDFINALVRHRHIVFLLQVYVSMFTSMTATTLKRVTLVKATKPVFVDGSVGECLVHAVVRRAEQYLRLGNLFLIH